MDIRLKRILFRAHHMGSNENDILFGGFATCYLSTLSPGQLDCFEALLAQNDTDLFNWATQKTLVPEPFNDTVMALLQHYVQGEAAVS